MRKYFITGLLVLVPLVITLWVLNLIIGTLDQSLLLLPPHMQPEALFGFHLPGFGTVVTLVIILLTGLVTRNIIGNRLLVLWELLLKRIPVVNSIYSSVKQVSDTLLSSSGNAFRKALLPDEVSDPADDAAADDAEDEDDVSDLAALLPALLPAPPPPLPLRKSVTYQPVPLSWKPAAVSCFLNSALPHSGQSVSGASEIFCRTSLAKPQASQRYA